MNLPYALGALAVLVLLHYAYSLRESVSLHLIRFTSVVGIYLSEGVIYHRSVFKRQSIALAQLHKVEYAYHAAVGFSAVWIFTAQSGDEIVVGEYCPGLKRLLKTLEYELVPFSIKEWKRQFEEGDIEDTLLLWSSNTARSNVDTNQPQGPQPL